MDTTARPDPYATTEEELMAAIDGLRALFPNGYLRPGETVQDFIDEIRERDSEDEPQAVYL